MPDGSMVAPLLCLSLLAAGGLAGPAPDAPATGVTKCCNWRTRPECGIGDEKAGWLCPSTCACPGPGWTPRNWDEPVKAGDLLVGSPDEPGATVSNGYVGAWAPRGVPGSAGNPVCGVEHVKGVFTAQPELMVSGVRRASLADLGSWTITSFIQQIGQTRLPATASALDLRKAAYRVAHRAEGVECVQTTYAHRSSPHLLLSEFECTAASAASADSPVAVRVQQGRCNPTSVLDNYIYETLCPKPNGSHDLYTRQEEEALAPRGFVCSRSTMHWPETDETRLPVVGECHTEVPPEGLEMMLPAGGSSRLSLVSARFSNMDQLDEPGTDPVVAAAAAVRAVAAAPSGSLWEAHVAAMDELHAFGVEVEGSLELARVVNASLHALLGSYRADSPYSGAPEGLIATRYSGHAFWDVETWQWPTWLAFWPEQARQALAYRFRLRRQAAANAGQPDVFLSTWPKNETGSRPRLAGYRFPMESALTGAEQEGTTDEDHMDGDVSTAFRQYWYGTKDRAWLREQGFPIIEGIAQFYASRVTERADGAHILHTGGPDEYHFDVDDSTFGNAMAAAALRSAYELAPLAGAPANATYARIAERLVLPYDAKKDYHPGFAAQQWATRSPRLVKQADTVLMYYPLNTSTSASTKRHDVETYARLQDPKGVAMTWGMQAIVSLDIGDEDAAADYFRRGYEAFARPPFYTWHEANGTDGSDGQGAPNLVTAAGGFLQSVWAGYGGVRFGERLKLQAPRPLPGSSRLKLRGVHYLGARLDIDATAEGWSVALNPRSPSGAPALELLTVSRGAQQGPRRGPERISREPLRRRAGEHAEVAQVESEQLVQGRPVYI